MYLEQNTINSLQWLLGIFEAHKVPYQISGGLAAHLYGANRPLNDIDVEISETRFAEILPDIQQFVVYGPDHFKDEKWDCQLIVLNYEGQKINIGGSDSLMVSNKEGTAWMPAQKLPYNTLDVNIHDMLTVKVMHPRELLELKKELNGEHQQVDIDAIQKYLTEHGL